MSGSPIIRNGKLVGAVTHVLVEDPERSYGVSIEEMPAKVESAGYDGKKRRSLSPALFSCGCSKATILPGFTKKTFFRRREAV